VPKQLTTQNATITTVAVEVKALTIGSKQVTLSVFRQLQEEPLIAKDGTLNGVPWGFVNYHPDKCGDSRRQHWHLVWQHGEELRRARVDVEPSFDQWRSDDHEFAPDEADGYVEAWVREWLHGRLTSEPLTKDSKRSWNGGSYKDECRLRHGNLIVWCEVPKIVLDAANAKLTLDHERAEMDENPSEFRQSCVTKAEQTFRGALAALDAEVDSWGCSFDEVQTEYKQVVDREAERRQRHREVRAGLAQLPQLFIAV
jgi:hypothetical protein